MGLVIHQALLRPSKDALPRHQMEEITTSGGVISPPKAAIPSTQDKGTAPHAVIPSTYEAGSPLLLGATLPRCDLETLLRIQHDLANANRIGRDLNAFIIRRELKGLFKGELARGSEGLVHISGR